MVFLVVFFLVVVVFSKPIGFMHTWQNPLNYGVCAPALRFVVGMCQTMMVGGLAVTIY